MNDITRHGPRFTLIIGFDLGEPAFGFKKYRLGHYALVLFYLEIHLQLGKARDLFLDVFHKGIDAMIVERSNQP